MWKFHDHLWKKVASLVVADVAHELVVLARFGTFTRITFARVEDYVSPAVEERRANAKGFDIRLQVIHFVDPCIDPLIRTSETSENSFGNEIFHLLGTAIEVVIRVGELEIICNCADAING